MKKIIIIILLVVITFTSCQREAEVEFENYVDLYNYEDIKIDYEYTQISDEEVKLIIENELSVNEKYILMSGKKYLEENDIALILINNCEEYYFVGSDSLFDGFDEIIKGIQVGDTVKMNNNTLGLMDVTLLGIYRTVSIKDEETILKYYNYSSIEDVEKFIRKRAYEEIIFNHVYDMIYENSLIKKLPMEIQDEIDSQKERYKIEILKYYDSFESYLKENDITENEFDEIILSSYYDVILYKAILEKEKISINREDVENYIKSNNLQAYDFYDAYKEITYPIVKNILVSKTDIVSK